LIVACFGAGDWSVSGYASMRRARRRFRPDPDGRWRSGSGRNPRRGAG